VRVKRKPKSLPTWHIIRLKASPAAFVGMVYAADRESAIKTAIKQFEIRPADQRRLLAIKR
jgi:hypothetical protein